ncbi:hypothetical protein PPYR_09372 [Photinus pyralis]|uniref:DUF4806 domain-containing protein n=1 Tax=Photinus pyralis TaxID=7054 RepID=A0A1Y1LCG1_PHOPY|nr:uncharacterized protein LOC116172343 isoform X2 [Photinus pyralis]XP_031357880.1 uncharacterized protein LOC116181636 isoform X2 [Photinus pyralis]KAB0790670.1 hypothetical protein PPYR_14884 [Photinus pyralis]KAB0798379.1 hypothetical protein PPYR_09372 [Photinus pyralis]
MSFIGIEFDNDAVDEIAVVHSTWMSPHKKHVWWPPYKSSKTLNKALSCGEEPDENTWVAYAVKRKFFECDALEKSLKKLQRCETTSDVQTTDTEQDKKRQRKHRRISSSSADEDDEVVSSIKRPPRISHCVTTPTTRSPLRVLSVQSIASRSTVSCSPSPSVTSVAAVEQPDRETSNIDDNLHVSIKQLYKLVALVKRQNEQLSKQNDEILHILKNKPSQLDSTNLHHQPELPVNFPIENLEEVDLIEEYLTQETNLSALSSYMSTIGGRDITSKTNTILRYVFTNGIAVRYSFLGSRGNKKAFSTLKLCKAIIAAVLVSLPNTLEIDVNNCIKVWLKHAPQRLALEAKRNV